RLVFLLAFSSFFFFHALLFFFLLLIWPPPRSSLFPTRRSSDLGVSCIFQSGWNAVKWSGTSGPNLSMTHSLSAATSSDESFSPRSEEHTSELQSLTNLVCRLLLEKKKNILQHRPTYTHHHVPTQ